MQIGITIYSHRGHGDDLAYDVVRGGEWHQCHRMLEEVKGDHRHKESMVPNIPLPRMVPSKLEEERELNLF